MTLASVWIRSTIGGDAADDETSCCSNARCLPLTIPSDIEPRRPYGLPIARTGSPTSGSPFVHFLRGL
jgi:hypothetical protein